MDLRLSGPGYESWETVIRGGRQIGPDAIPHPVAHLLDDYKHFLKVFLASFTYNSFGHHMRETEHPGLQIMRVRYFHLAFGFQILCEGRHPVRFRRVILHHQDVDR